MQSEITLSLPDWFDEHFKNTQKDFSTLQGRMRFVIALGKQNVLQSTGGPFSAAIFNIENGQIISCGVNRVSQQFCSAAHGQMMALMLGQKSLQTYDFSLIGRYQIITSAKMCAMCFGNAIWSGISQIVSSATIQDIETITGLYQGPLPASYNFELEKRGINLVDCFLQQQGRNLLKFYKQNGLLTTSDQH